MSKKYRFQIPRYEYYEINAQCEEEALDQIILKKVKPSKVHDFPNWDDAVEVTDA